MSNIDFKRNCVQLPLVGLCDTSGDGITTLATFTTSTLPPPSPAGQIIYLSDIDEIAVSDGTQWNWDSPLTPGDVTTYSSALIANSFNNALFPPGNDNTFSWVPEFQFNVTGGATPGQTVAPSGNAPGLTSSPAFVITAPIYYEVTYLSGTTPAPVGLQISGGGAVTAGMYSPGVDYAFGISMEPASGTIYAQYGPPFVTPFPGDILETGVSLPPGTTLGVWIDIPNNNVNYTYNGTLHTTDPVTGTNPIAAPTDFNLGAAGAVTTSNLFSGSGVIPGGAGDMVSVKINIGQTPFVHNPKLMVGTVDWFGNPL